MKNLPPAGFTLVDLCRICASHAVYMNIGVAIPDIALSPTRITIQLSQPKREDVEAFAIDMQPGNPRLNLAMSVLVMQRLERYAPKRSKLIVL